MTLAKCLVLILLVLSIVVARALPDRGGEPVSGTRAFTIDGRKFLVEVSTGDGFPLVERELAKRGVDTFHTSANLASVLGTRSVASLREDLAEEGAFPLPRGLEPDHVLRLEAVTGPVEIAFGHVVCGEEDILGRLRASGWECRKSDTFGVQGAFAELTKRKESSFVLMEKSERRFLAIRRAVR